MVERVFIVTCGSGSLKCIICTRLIYDLFVSVGYIDYLEKNSVSIEVYDDIPGCMVFLERGDL